MNKKKLIAMVMTSVMLLPTVALAKGNSHNEGNNGQAVVSQQKAHNNGQENSSEGSKKDSDEANEHDKDKTKNENINKGEDKKEENQQNKDDKKQQIEAFKTQMRAKHETMKQIRQQTIAVRQQVESKTSQLNSIIKEIEAGKKTLSADMLNALLSKSQNLNIDSSSVKATAEVKSEVSDTQDKTNKKDFNNALSSLDKVIAKLQARLNALQQLNSDLDEVLAIANLATAPAPAASSVPTENQTTTNTTTTNTTPTNTTTSSNTQSNTSTSTSSSN